MDYMAILRRAARVTWSYKALWFFGFLAALFGGGGGWGGWGGGGRGSAPLGNARAFPGLEITPGFIAAVVLGVLLLVALAIVLNLVSNAALIGLVREAEAGQPVGVRKGFRIGLGRFWALLGIALIVGVPLLLLTVGMVLLGLSPLLLLFAKAQAAKIVGVIMMVVLMIPIVLIIVALNAVLDLLMEFFRRACVLEHLGVTASLGHGWDVFSGHLKDSIVMAILLFGCSLAFGVLMVPVSLALIGGPMLVALALWAAFHSVALALGAGLAFGVPAMVLLVFLAGVFKAFTSSVWTLAYLHMTNHTEPPVGNVPQGVVAEAQE